MKNSQSVIRPVYGKFIIWGASLFFPPFSLSKFPKMIPSTKCIRLTSICQMWVKTTLRAALTASSKDSPGKYVSRYTKGKRTVLGAFFKLNNKMHSSRSQIFIELNWKVHLFIWEILSTYYVLEIIFVTVGYNHKILTFLPSRVF